MRHHIYILNDFTSDYKSQLIQTHLLPLTYINDVMFLSRAYKLPVSIISLNLQLAAHVQLQVMNFSKQDQLISPAKLLF